MIISSNALNIINDMKVSSFKFIGIHIVLFKA